MDDLFNPPLDTVRESHIENACVAFAKRKGWMVRKVHFVAHRGAPDRLFIRNGRLVWVEFKAPGKKPRPDQLAEIERLQSEGLEVEVIDNVDDFKGKFA